MRQRRADAQQRQEEATDQVTRARRLLLEVLASGPVPVVEVNRQASLAGIRTVVRTQAMRHLGVVESVRPDRVSVLALGEPGRRAS